MNFTDVLIRVFHDRSLKTTCAVSVNVSNQWFSAWDDPPLPFCTSRNWSMSKRHDQLSQVEKEGAAGSECVKGQRCCPTSYNPWGGLLQQRTIQTKMSIPLRLRNTLQILMPQELSLNMTQLNKDLCVPTKIPRKYLNPRPLLLFFPIQICKYTVIYI